MPTSNALPVADYLKYADLQMAAEAFIRAPISGSLASGQDLIAALADGNKHASRFTEPQAQAFEAQWEAIDQQANTATGFSGTLFRSKASGELVLSFRSTEFIDDAARDNQATNAMELAQYGFAFGQIRDMEDWYASLQQQRLIPTNAQIAVTGYSLGGHLATAFNLLHNTETVAPGMPRIKEVVTFNGAGLGGIDPSTDLAHVIADFRRLSENLSGQEFVFSDPALAALYQRARAAIGAGGAISNQDQQALYQMAYPNGDPGAAVNVYTLKQQQAQGVVQAISRINTIRAEVTRLTTLTSGDASNSQPLNVPNGTIGQENLDYQMAVLAVQEKTGAASLVGGAVRAIGGKQYGGSFANQFDVVGAAGPSAVANSQWHWGQDVQVFIEDQPLVRGGAFGAAVYESFRNGDVKLLVPGYTNRDFGDTHSLVLLVDSLNVQNALLQLLPPSQRQSAGPTLNAVLVQASYLSKEDGPLIVGGGQGKAEGDVLENVVNALADLVLGPGNGERLKGSPDGNTWWLTDGPAGYSGRTAFYSLLSSVLANPLYASVVSGAVTLALTSSASDLASRARADFGAYAALYSLTSLVDTPLSLHGDDHLEGGAGADQPTGGGRDDILFGGSGDELYAGDLVLLQDALAAGQSGAGSGLRGDLLSGGTGEDLLIGAAGKDLLFGGAGADVIAGRQGDDDISGDLGLSTSGTDWGVTRSVEQVDDPGPYGPVALDIHSWTFTAAAVASEAPSQDEGDVIEGGAGDRHFFVSAFAPITDRSRVDFSSIVVGRFDGAIRRFDSRRRKEQQPGLPRKSNPCAHKLVYESSGRVA